MFMGIADTYSGCSPIALAISGVMKAAYCCGELTVGSRLITADTVMRIADAAFIADIPVQ